VSNLDRRDEVAAVIYAMVLEQWAPYSDTYAALAANLEPRPIASAVLELIEGGNK
jgi:hypothetical protein